MKRSLLIVLLCLTGASPSFAKKKVDLSKDFDSLGGNDVLVERARALNPRNRVRIVQKRTVDRNYRFEVDFDYGGVAMGDTYIRTENVGGTLHFHFNPRWSVGVRYYKSLNALTQEGESVYDRAASLRTNVNANYAGVPDVDYPINTTMGMINWYPIYGKLNIFDRGVTQFDLYLLAGAGQVELYSGPTSTFTAGLGVGMWWTRYISSRLEVRYQNYKDQPLDEERNLNLAVASFSLGLLL